MRFTYYYRDLGNATCYGTANIDVKDILEIAKKENMREDFVETGICINGLLRKNAETGNDIIVWIDPVKSKVSVERSRYFDESSNYKIEDVEDLKISEDEIKILLLFEEVSYLLNRKVS